MEMNDEQKEAARDRVNSFAVAAARKAAARAKTVSGWKKWAAVIATALLALLAGLTQVGCSAVTAERVHAVHTIYHALTGKPCAFDVTGGK